MNALVAHIEALNAEKAAWVAEDPTNRWAGMITTDVDHWAEYGVFTVEDYERHMIIAGIWDAYKDAYGVRPRGTDFESMSLEELKEFQASVYAAADAQFEHEQKIEQENVDAFEARVLRTMINGANNRGTAIRWILEAELTDDSMLQDPGYVCYSLGLPYSYESEFGPVLEQLARYANAEEELAQDLMKYEKFEVVA